MSPIQLQSTRKIKENQIKQLVASGRFSEEGARVFSDFASNEPYLQVGFEEFKELWRSGSIITHYMDMWNLYTEWGILPDDAPFTSSSSFQTLLWKVRNLPLA